MSSRLRRSLLVARTTAVTVTGRERSSPGPRPVVLVSLRRADRVDGDRVGRRVGDRLPAGGRAGLRRRQWLRDLHRTGQVLEATAGRHLTGGAVDAGGTRAAVADHGH